MWKSTSSSGWEYFDCVRGLGFESYGCQLCVLIWYYFKYMLVVMWNNIILEFY